MKVKQIVHLRVYRGRELTYNKNGNITTENWVIKEVYGIPEWYLTLKMLRPNGFCEVVVEKVTQLQEDGVRYVEVHDFSKIAAEVAEAFMLPTEKLSPEQQRIADLEKTIAEMRSMLKGSYTAPKESFVVPNKLDETNNIVEKQPTSKLDELETLQAEYLTLKGEKAHHLWKAERLKAEIAVLKENK